MVSMYLVRLRMYFTHLLRLDGVCAPNWLPHVGYCRIPTTDNNLITFSDDQELKGLISEEMCEMLRDLGSLKHPAAGLADETIPWPIPGVGEPDLRLLEKGLRNSYWAFYIRIMKGL